MCHPYWTFELKAPGRSASLQHDVHVSSPTPFGLLQGLEWGISCFRSHRSCWRCPSLGHQQSRSPRTEVKNIQLRLWKLSDKRGCLTWMSPICVFSLSPLYHVEKFHYLGVRNCPSAALFLCFFNNRHLMGCCGAWLQTAFGEREKVCEGGVLSYRRSPKCPTSRVLCWRFYCAV